MIRRLFLEAKTVRLCCVDFGGEGAPALLLHGLAGRASEWRNTAQWLTHHCHVLALDQREHGLSQKATGDCSRDAYVADAIATIEHLRLQPVLLIGQSLGGLNGFLVAARRPDLVRGLVVVEASPSANPAAPCQLRDWIARWPVPFPTLADARAFFGGDTLSAATWLEVLEERPDGYWPQFRIESMVQSLADVAARDYWAEWERVCCPTLVVGGEHSFLAQEELQEMARRIRTGRYVQIPEAGHDLHLEQPEAWRQVVEAFLSDLGADVPPAGT